MSIDVIEIDPDPWPRVLLMAAMWCLPTILFVLRRQLPSGATVRRKLAVAQWILVLGAAVYSLASLGVIDPTDELLRLGILFFASAVFLAAFVLAIFGLGQKRRSGGVI